MPFNELTGADILQMMIDRLGGYANGVTGDVMMDLLNEGKDKVWSILKQLNENFFQTSSQFTDNTLTNYFAPFDTKNREYQLPADFRAIRFMECVTNGYTAVRFHKSLMTDPEWQAARRNANDASIGNIGTGIFEFHYDIVESSKGGFELVFAEFFALPLQAVVWYLRGLPDFEAGDTLNQIIRPYVKAIVNFAVKQAMKVLQDEPLSAQWLETWRDDVIGVAQGAGPINQAEPRFVTDFYGS